MMLLGTISPENVSTVQHRFLEFIGEIGCVGECRFQILNKSVKQAFLFRGLSVKLLMVLIAGLEGRLLMPFSLWLGSILIRLTC